MPPHGFGRLQDSLTGVTFTFRLGNCAVTISAVVLRSKNGGSVQRVGIGTEVPRGLLAAWKLTKEPLALTVLKTILPGESALGSLSSARQE